MNTRNEIKTLFEKIENLRNEIRYCSNDVIFRRAELSRNCHRSEELENVITAYRRCYDRLQAFKALAEDVQYDLADVLRTEEALWKLWDEETENERDGNNDGNDH